MNGYDFTERVRRVLPLAREEAARLRHDRVDTEHLLLAIVGEGGGVAAAVLQNLGLDLDGLRRAVEARAGQGSSAQATGRDLPYASAAKTALELAMAEVRELAHTEVGTEHLLLGLLREEHGVAAQVLTELGAPLGAVRTGTLALLAYTVPDAPRAVPPAVAGVTVDVRFADGSIVREEFHDVMPAIGFLGRQR